MRHRSALLLTIALGCSDITGPGRSPTVWRIPGDFVELAVADSHACGLTRDGVAYCWGDMNAVRSASEVPVGPDSTGKAPAEVPGVRLAHIIVAYRRACGVTQTGEAYCWGHDLTSHDRPDTATGPIRVGGDSVFSLITAGEWYTCGVTAAQLGYCWGRGDLGGLGTGNFEPTSSPMPINGNMRWVAMAAKQDHSEYEPFACGLRAEGDVYCWGSDSYAQLGGMPLIDYSKSGAFEHGYRDYPIDVRTLERYRAIAVGGKHACALGVSGKAYCWGSNNNGQLGVEQAGSKCELFQCAPNPSPVATKARFTTIVAGSDHTCALTAEGEVYCWGAGIEYQTAPDVAITRSRPKRVSDRPYRAIYAGGRQTCGITRAGETFCWRFHAKSIDSTLRSQDMWWLRKWALLFIGTGALFGAAIARRLQRSWQAGGLAGGFVGVFAAAIALVWYVLTNWMAHGR